MRGQYDICLMTYEKCAALLLGNPHLLEQVGTIVIDEVQMIAEELRGVNLEFLLSTCSPGLLQKTRVCNRNYPKECATERP
jgi:replicative superfamily II helicase